MNVQIIVGFLKELILALALSTSIVAILFGSVFVSIIIPMQLYKRKMAKNGNILALDLNTIVNLYYQHPEKWDLKRQTYRSCRDDKCIKVEYYLPLIKQLQLYLKVSRSPKNKCNVESLNTCILALKDMTIQLEDIATKTSK